MSEGALVPQYSRFPLDGSYFNINGKVTLCETVTHATIDAVMKRILCNIRHNLAR